MSSRFLFRKRFLTSVLLGIWGCLNFVLPFFARDLSFTVGGWPLHFWLASQGALLVFLAIVALYAWLVNRWEAEAAPASEDADPS